MDFKQAIIENAWGGISVDYGLLHLQLATPFAVFIVLFIMIYALNKLLFQPVLRTLDNRTDAIAKSEQTVIQVSEEVESWITRNLPGKEQSMRQAEQVLSETADPRK